MRKFYRGSLALRVLVISVVLFAVPLLVYFLVVLHESYGQRLGATVSQLVDLGRSRAEDLQDVYDNSVHTLNVIEQFSEFSHKDISLSQLNEILGGLKRSSAVDVAFFLQKEGSEWIVTASSSPKLVGRDLSAYHIVTGALVERNHAFLDYGEEGFAKSLYVSRALREWETGEVIGILTLVTDIEPLVAEMIREAKTTYPITVSLLDGSFDVFASSNPSLVQRHIYLEREDSDQSKVTFVPSSPGRMAGQLKFEGEDYVGVEVSVKGTDLSVLITASEHAVYSRERGWLIQVLVLFFGLLIVGGGLALWLTQRMSVPWRRLEETMQRVSQGDLTARCTEDRMGFEINTLGRIFNETIDSLTDQMAQAESERVQKETLRKELAIGKEIQMAILPQRRPEFPGVDVSARYLPAKEVGGDFYDFYARKNDLVLTVADAAGKGISACLYSLGLRSILRSCYASGGGVAEIAEQANRLFWEDAHQTEMFVTAIIAVYDPAQRVARYVSAGHNPGLVCRSNGNVERLEGGGLAMGIDSTQRFEEHKVALSSGDLLVLFTDGVTEARNPRGALFGEARFEEVFQRIGGDAEVVADAVVKAIVDFEAGSVATDDLTLVVLRIL
jgi:serine phosphatase RsbU (regulator of sigma subunit)